MNAELLFDELSDDTTAVWESTVIPWEGAEATLEALGLASSFRFEKSGGQLAEDACSHSIRWEF
jgi:hypothetical protein